MPELTLELRAAAESDDVEAINALIEAGADPNAKNHAGNTVRSGRDGPTAGCRASRRRFHHERIRRLPDTPLARPCGTRLRWTESAWKATPHQWSQRHTPSRPPGQATCALHESTARSGGAFRRLKAAI